MIQVLDHLHQYAPTKSSRKTVDIPNSEQTVEITTDSIDPVLFGKYLLGNIYNSNVMTKLMMYEYTQIVHVLINLIPARCLDDISKY